jgi:serine/threonine protein kinase
MELMEGGSLTSAYDAARAAAGPAWRPPVARALRHAAQLFRALEHLHAQAPAILHRDIKPANLLLTADLETLKLADFAVLFAHLALSLVPP